MSPLETVLRPLGRALIHRRAGLERSVRSAPALQSPNRMPMSSTSFADGGEIPAIHSPLGKGRNLSPALSWSDVPAGTRQLLFVMEDVDVPSRLPSLHVSMLFGPEVTGFAEGEISPDNAALRFIPRMGRVGWFGPRPLPGHGPHRYGFHLYAIDIAIPATTKLTAFAQVLPLVDGHLLASGLLVGVQED